MAKFHQAAPFGFKVKVANSLQLRPILDPPLKKIVRGTQVPGGGSASKIWSFYGACKNLGVQRPIGAEIWSSEKVN